MSRASALARTLRLPTMDQVEVITVPPTGDCFYDCLDLLLPPPSSDNPDDEGGGEARRRCHHHRRPSTMADAGAMRHLVSSRMTQSLFEHYRMFADAGVEDFAWMNHHHAPTSLEELRDFAKVSGREVGAGQCLWADEHALRTVSDEAGVTILIVDEQVTTRRGNRSGRRRRGRDESEYRPDGRFVAIGDYDWCVFVRRSRRQHYDALIVCGRGTIRRDEIPPETRALWPTLSVSLSPVVVDSPVDSVVVVAYDTAAKKEEGNGREAGGGDDHAKNDEDTGVGPSLSSSRREASSSAPPPKKARGEQEATFPESDPLSISSHGGGASMLQEGTQVWI